jgi:nicotinamidase-related amidase
MSQLKTIRDIAGLGNASTAISDSALVIIDAQNTYCEGVMKLEGMEKALQECRVLLDRFRKAGRPVFIFVTMPALAHPTMSPAQSDRLLISLHQCKENQSLPKITQTLSLEQS